MKKMQCEVCGSTEFKKTPEGFFECQSCGIQYGVEEAKKILMEVTGKVKIDHSEEIQNHIKRGEQYEDDGNLHKANEHYNKALDFDAENEVAREKIKKLKNDGKLASYYIIEPDVDPKENVKDFFNQLSVTNNIVCDIYKHIEIKSVTEKFYTFNFVKRKEEVRWNAIACHKYYENETVYESRYDSTLRKTVKEPVTKKVERINRVPVSGTMIENGESLAFASDAAKKSIEKVQEQLKNDLFLNFEDLQDEKYGSYNVKKLDPQKVENKEDKLFYGEYELDLQEDIRNLSAQKNKISNMINEKIKNRINNGKDCDYYENFSGTTTILNDSVASVCLPMQIIEYVYKGKEYVAVSDLLSHTTTIPMIYPCDSEMANEMAALQEEKKKANNNPLHIVGLVTSLLGLACLLLGALFSAEDFFIPVMLGLFAISIIFFIIGAITEKHKQQKFSDHAQQIKETMFNPRIEVLTAGKNAFFNEYTDYTSAKAAAASTADFSIKHIHSEVSKAGILRKKMEFVTNDVDKDHVIKTLESEIKVQKKIRNRAILISSVVGILLGTLGILFLSSTIWLYTLWGIAILLIAGGFGLALIGSICILGKKNALINDYSMCITRHAHEIQCEEEFENPQDNKQYSDFGNKWTPEYINKIVSKIEETEKQRENIKADGTKKAIINWVKNHKIPSIIIASSVLLIILATVIESISVSVTVHKYEKVLYDRTYVATKMDYTSSGSNKRHYQTDRSYRFLKNNKYQYNSKSVYIDNNEEKETFDGSGKYKIRFELFSGKPCLMIDNFITTDLAYTAEYDLYYFKYFGNTYYLIQADDVNNEDTMSDNSLSNNGNSNSDSGSTNNGSTNTGSGSTNSESSNSGSGSTNSGSSNSGNGSTNSGSSNSGNGSTNSGSSNSDSGSNNSGSSNSGSGSSNSGSSNSGSSSTTTSCRHSFSSATCNKLSTCNLCGETKGSFSDHSWQAITTTVHHEEIGHYETVSIPNYLDKYRCPLCGYNATKYTTITEYYAHFDSAHGSDPNSRFMRDRYEIVEDIEYTYEQKWVIDTEAYDETVVTGYTCSVCGKEK